MAEKKPYLPKVRTDYHPTKSECQTYSVSDTDVNLPNPAVDPIVVNNIASQEFDYTQDMMSDSAESSYKLKNNHVKKF